MERPRREQHSDDDEFSYERQIREHSDAENMHDDMHNMHKLPQPKYAAQTLRDNYVEIA